MVKKFNLVQPLFSQASLLHELIQINCYQDYTMSLPNIAVPASILAIGASIICLPCINRSNVKIGVVHHGVPTDVYWQGMNIAINQGAKDMGIDLYFDPLVNKVKIPYMKLFVLLYVCRMIPHLICFFLISGVGSAG